MPKYKLHILSGDRKNELAIDIDGRKSSYRLIVEPVDHFEKSSKDMNFFRNINQ